MFSHFAFQFCYQVVMLPLEYVLPCSFVIFFSKCICLHLFLIYFAALFSQKCAIAKMQNTVAQANDGGA